MGRDSPLGEARARYTASVISGQATEILKDEYISWNIGFADMEVINLQLVKKAAARRKMLQWLFIFITCGIVIIFAALLVLNSPYLGWDYSDPELAVAGVLYHAAEWLFVRLAPIILIGTIAGIFLTRKKRLSGLQNSSILTDKKRCTII